MRCRTVGPNNAKIFFVGEAPGQEEEATGNPFVGYAGRTFDGLLTQAGINRYECLVSNVSRDRPPSNKISFFFEDKKCTIPKPNLVKDMLILKQELEMYRPNVVVALGATALWALTGEKRIGKFRGYVMPCKLVEGLKVIPTYHPQNINYEWKNHFPTILDLRKAKKHSAFPEIIPDNREIRADVKIKEFIDYLEYLIAHKEHEYLSLDIESNKNHPSMFGLSHSDKFAMSFSLVKGKYPTIPMNDEVWLYQLLDKVLRMKKIIMQNAAYDASVLYMHQRFQVLNLWMDTLIGAHICWPEMPRDLGFLASICIDVPPWKHLSDTNKSYYNACDAINTYSIAGVIDRLITSRNLRKTFEFEMSELPVAQLLQLQGIKVDQSRKEELREEISQNIDSTKEALDLIIKRPINFGSHQQLKKLLYVDMKLQVQYKKRKSVSDPKIISSDAKALKRLQILYPNNTIFQLILEHKKWLKRKTFIKKPLSPQNRAHTSYNITGSSEEDKGKKSFGRWSSSKSIILPYGSGNLQNIPEYIRRMYVPDDGMELGAADYVQAEAVVVAYLCHDPVQIDMFKKAFGLRGKDRDPYDIHKYTIHLMSGIPVSEVTKEQRTVGKVIRHMSNYDAGPGEISIKLGCSMADAKQYKEVYIKANPLLRVWHQSLQDQLQKSRVMTNLLGREHRFLDRWPSAQGGSNLFKSVYSYNPQSTVGDLLNESMVKIYNKHSHWIHILLQLHDAIYFMCKPKDKEKAAEAIRECMIRPIPVDHEVMTIDVDFKFGPSWGEMEEVDWI